MLHNNFLNRFREKIFFKSDIPITYNTGYFAFFFVLIMYPIIQLIMKPSWMLGGGLFQEASTNYYFYANSPLWSERLFATDAGYVQLPQRLIALLGTLLRFPDAVIPYYYTWVGTILTGLMGAVFCLPRFRILVRSDALRALTSFILLFGLNFETTTFINFTYFDIIPIALCSALALADDTRDVPKWAWFIPLLFWAKPSVLSGLPMVCAIAFISKPRFQKIAVISFLISVVQIFTLYIYHQKGVFAVTENYTFFEKIFAAFLYFPSAFSLYALGIATSNYKTLILIGYLFFFSILIFSFLHRDKINSLFFVGMNIVFFSSLINVFAISVIYNFHIYNYTSPNFSRYNVTCFWGAILVVCGVVEHVSKKIQSLTGRSLPYLSVSLLFAWLLATNFHGKLLGNSLPPTSPFLGNSMWQEMAPLLKATHERLCIPVDPFPRTYDRGCQVLYRGIEPQEASYKEAPSIDSTGVMVTMPQGTQNGNLLYVSVPARPFVGNSFVSAQLLVKMKNGSEEIFSGSRALPISGGIIFLRGKHAVKISDIDTIVLKTDREIEVLFNDKISKDSPVIMPMGFM